MSDNHEIRDAHPDLATHRKPGVERATSGLRRRIAVMGPGDEFPPVPALAQEYEVSEPTLRRALQGLRGLRLVENPDPGRGGWRIQGGAAYQTPLERAVSELRADITGMAPGSVLQPFADLEFDYQASDTTLRKALRILQAEGLVEQRNRASGSGWARSAKPRP